VRNSLLLGLGLSIRFSTGIIIIKFLFNNNIINSQLYSVIITSSIIFTFIVPILFSAFIPKTKNKKINIQIDKQKL
jgi:Kef-type K+ transport system membrane component KefB